MYSNILGRTSKKNHPVPDCELEMPGDDAGLLVVPGGVPGKLKDLGGKDHGDQSLYCTLYLYTRLLYPQLSIPSFKKVQSPRNSWTLLFFQTISPPCLGLCFFQTAKNYKFSLYPFLTFFSPRVLETHFGGLKAACIGPALSKFRPSVGGGATYCTLYTVDSVQV